MTLTKDIHYNISQILKNRCLNTCEVCRLLNGISQRNYDFCYLHQPFGEDRTWKTKCRSLEHDCKYDYVVVWHALKKLEAKKKIRSLKTPFLDFAHPERPGIYADTFRFWFEHENDFAFRLIQDLVLYFSPFRSQVVVTRESSLVTEVEKHE